MICDLELIKDIHLLDGKTIVFWGAGHNGRMAYKKLKYMLRKPSVFGNKVLFCDNDSEKWGKNIGGNGRVISPCTLLELAGVMKLFVLVSSEYVNEIVQQTEQIKLTKIAKVCTWFGFQTAVYFHFKDEIFNEIFKEEYEFEMRFNMMFLKSYYQFNFIKSKGDFFYIADYEHPVYIIQPGKVGSKTIVSSLRKRGVPCAMLHRLEFFKEDEEVNAGYYQKSFEALKKKGMNIIVPVREPIARDISAFWYTMDKLIYARIADSDIILFFEKFLKEIYNPRIDIPLIPFEPRYKKISVKFGDQGRWFRETIEALFGVDVFAYPFDKEKGYTVIQQGNIRLLLLQMEKMNQLETVIGDFVGVKNFVLKSENEAKNYLYYPAQKTFLEKMRLPREYIDRCYGKESFVHHFYAEKDLSKFMEKWEKHIE